LEDPNGSVEWIHLPERKAIMMSFCKNDDEDLGSIKT
jgi:hypothetical protein